LFSVVFDGHSAPAHGTLIELRSRFADENAEPMRVGA
jgi:hypothetical protein